MHARCINNINVGVHLANIKGVETVNIFVYDAMLNPEYRKLLKVHPVEERIAETTGKMYNVHRQPILLLPKDITYSRGHCRIFGAILTFNDEDEDKVFDAFDNYKGCSMSRIGRMHPQDLAYRSTIKVYPIKANSIQEFEDFSYGHEKPVKCVTYLGNPKNQGIIHTVKFDRHHKFSQGYYPEGFTNILQRSGF